MTADRSELILHLHTLAERVHLCADEPALSELLDELCDALGADHWVYVTFLRGEDALGSYRFLAGCSPAWCQHYVRQRWYLNDPMLAYATEHAEPAIASTIAPQTAGQRRLLDAAREYGFSAGMIVPAHSAAHLRIGVLYVAYCNPSALDSEIYTASRLPLRALSAEVLDRILVSIRTETIERCGLDERELTLLRYQRAGLSSKDIARLGEGSPHAIDRMFGRIIHKLGLSSRAEAAHVAYVNGLI